MKDGELKPACAQSCPATAIVFGDLNDPESQASRLSRSARGEKLLEDLGRCRTSRISSRRPPHDGWHPARRPACRRP
jgi:molybdopterin-containing oxidoreductase family iron-sulfur binding subunit